MSERDDSMEANSVKAPPPKAATLALMASMFGGALPPLPKGPSRKAWSGVSGERERQRHEWRARVDAAAREVQRSGHPDRQTLYRRGWRGWCDVWNAAFDARVALDAALSAPKPWRKR